jgi:hypothetical protein
MLPKASSRSERNNSSHGRQPVGTVLAAKPSPGGTTQEHTVCAAPLGLEISALIAATG